MGKNVNAHLVSVLGVLTRRLVRPPLRPPRSGAGARSSTRRWPACATGTRSPTATSTEGYWVVTRHDDVLRVAQDWQTFSSAHGVSVPQDRSTRRRHPRAHRSAAAEELPPGHQRLLHAAGRRPVTSDRRRDLVTRLIDGFIERRLVRLHGRLRPAVPRPRLLRPDAQRTGRPARSSSTRRSMAATNPTNPDAGEAVGSTLNTWIADVRGDATRRSHPAAMSSTRSSAPTSTAGRSPNRRSSG